jgi:hypothetical protein
VNNAVPSGLPDGIVVDVHDRRGRFTPEHPRFAVEEKPIHERSPCRVDSELDVHVVVGVVRRVGDLEALPPLAADDLLVFVLAGFQIEEVAVHGNQCTRAVGRDSSHHRARLFATRELIVGAHFSQLEIGPMKVDTDEIHDEWATAVDELSERDARSELA